MLAALPLLLAASCVQVPDTPESAAVSRLKSQGFTLVSDGRSSDQPSALTYSGDPAAVIVCGSKAKGYTAAAQTKSITARNGLKVKQTGLVDAYVIVANDGGQSGLYINTVTREVRSGADKLFGRQIEKIEFAPDAQGRFKDGLICKARS
ncbi:MAG: hypothetical protein WBN04_19595 [Paracoccaceae bacterium]